MPELILRVYAASLEAARQKLAEQLPEGYRVIREKTRNAEFSQNQTATTALAVTIEKARARALTQLPPEAIILDIETAPETPVALILWVRVEEEPQQAALDLMVKKYGHDAHLIDLKLLEDGQRGWLGLGARPAKYRVDILKPARCTIEYRPALEVEFTAADFASVESTPKPFGND